MGRIAGVVVGAWLVVGCAGVPGGAQDAGHDGGLPDAGPPDAGPSDAGLGAFIATGLMTVQRVGHAAALLASGKVLIVGGSNPAQDLASAEVFDPAAGGGVGAFTLTGSMGTPRWAPAASRLAGGKVLVAGGVGASTGDGGSATDQVSAELFDPAGNGGAGAFTATGSMASARSMATAVLLADGRVLVVGGRGDPGSPFSAELFDPAAGDGGAFTAILTLGHERVGATVTRLPDGRVLIAGGSQDAGTAELYVPRADGGVGVIVPTASLDTPRNFHVAALLPGGKVLIAGGYGRFGSPDVAEVYDPAGNGGVGAFAAITPPSSARAGATATTLATGKVLLAGGGAPDLGSAELYDPAGNAGAGAFAATGSQLTGRERATATLLPGGKVLVTGGASAATSALRSAELYVP
jgi:hypothetical protein